MNHLNHLIEYLEYSINLSIFSFPYSISTIRFFIKSSWKGKLWKRLQTSGNYYAVKILEVENDTNFLEDLNQLDYLTLLHLEGITLTNPKYIITSLEVFISPELMNGKKINYKKADVYAFGMTMYSILCDQAAKTGIVLSISNSSKAL